MFVLKVHVFEILYFHIFKPQLLFKTLKVSSITEHITYISLRFSNVRVDVCSLSSQRAF